MNKSSINKCQLPCEPSEKEGDSGVVILELMTMNPKSETQQTRS